MRVRLYWGVIGLLLLLTLNPVHAQTSTPPPGLTISGSVKSGTAGLALPAGLPLSLHVFRADPQKATQPDAVSEVVTRELALAGDTYRFENIPALPGDLCVVTTTFEGITQGSIPVTLSTLQPTLDLPIVLFGGAHDSGAVHITRTQQLLTFLSSSVMQVLETVEIENATDRFYLSEQKTPDGQPISIQLPLPIGARAIAFNTKPTTRFAIGGDANAPIVQDTRAVFPGQTDEIIFSYQLPYAKEAPIDRDYLYATDLVQVALPADAGVIVSGPSFHVIQNTSIDPKRPFMQYTLDTPLKAGGRLIYKLSGAPRETHPAQAPGGIDLGAALAVIGGLLLVVIVALVLARRALSRPA